MDYKQNSVLRIIPFNSHDKFNEEIYFINTLAGRKQEKEIGV